MQTTSRPRAAVTPRTPTRTSLDASETPVEVTAPTGERIRLGRDAGSLLRHSGWAGDRRRVFHALARTGQSASRLHRFAECGLGAWVARSVEEPDRLVVLCACCRDRWCVPCQRARTLTVRGNLSRWLHGRAVRFVTLTLRHTTAPLRQQIDHLYASFRRLRQSRDWQAHVTGGVAILELAADVQAGTWHPHLHCLVEGTYYPQRNLCDAWRRASRGSYIVDIRRPGRRDSTVTYVTKYITKPTPAAVIRTPAMLDEAITALHGRRLLLTFGTWSDAKLTQTRPHGTWEIIGPLDRILTAAWSGQEWAISIIQAVTGDTLWIPNRSPPVNWPTPGDSRQ